MRQNAWSQLARVHLLLMHTTAVCIRLAHPYTITIRKCGRGEILLRLIVVTRVSSYHGYRDGNTGAHNLETRGRVHSYYY